MKKEDAINLLKQVNEILINSNSWLENTHEPLNQAFDMAIKALEQQPSDDCISREELKKWLDMNFSFGGALRKLEMFDRIDKELPPVTPTRKVGKWIKTGGSFRCSECMAMPEFKDIRTLKYCPTCGAEMRGAENG